MPLKLRPTGLGAGIDKDRPDYTVYCGEWASAASMRPVAVPTSALVLVADRQRSDDAFGSRGDPGGSQGAVSEELGRLAWAQLREDTESCDGEATRLGASPRPHLPLIIIGGPYYIGP